MSRILPSFILAVVLLALSAGTGCIPDPYEVGEPDSLFSEFVLNWELVDAEYACFFASPSVDWTDVFHRYRPMAQNLGTRAEMVELTLQMMGELADLSLCMADSTGSRLDSYDKGYFHNWDREVWGAYMEELGGEDTLLRYSSFVLDPPYDSIGYLYISDLGNSFDISLFFASTAPIQNCSRLIMDLRMCNRSGREVSAQYAVGRFTAVLAVGYYRAFRTGPGRNDMGEMQPVYAYRNGAWQFTSPILVLTGRKIQTGAEQLVLLLMSQDHVTLVGDTTAGYANPSETLELLNGMKVQIPSMVTYSTDLDLIFNSGIPPDVVVPCSQEDFDSGIDPVLEAALEMVSQ